MSAARGSVTRSRWLPLALALLCALALARPARAAVTLDSYKLEVTPPREPGQPARFYLQLAYLVSGETKRSGFKYLGRIPASDVRVTDVAGRALSSTQELEVQSGEYLLRFDLPAANAAALQVVQIDFQQPLEASHAWGVLQGEVPWAHKFRIPVGSMRVTLHLPAELGAEEPAGYRCQEERGGRACVRVTQELLPVSVPLRAERGGLVVLAFCLLGALAFLATRVRALRQRWLAERGIIPPASPMAYPQGADPYRAPPPLATTPDPVLSPEDHRAFTRKIAMASAAALLCFLVVARIVSAEPMELPPPLLLSFGVVVSVMLFLLALRLEQTGLLLGGEGAALGPALVTGSQVALVVALSATLFVGLLAFIISRASRGGGGGGGSYSSGGSSCSSSSGGSSCGGGGGSSCGGGGGGGGCGG